MVAVGWATGRIHDVVWALDITGNVGEATALQATLPGAHVVVSTPSQRRPLARRRSSAAPTSHRRRRRRARSASVAAGEVVVVARDEGDAPHGEHHLVVVGEP
jgi:hypothetical protein